MRRNLEALGKKDEARKEESMMSNSYLNTYFDEDELPPEQPPIQTKGVKLVRTVVDFLLEAKGKTGYSMMGVITGPSGSGKSIAIHTVLKEVIARSPAGLPICLKIKAKPGSSPRQLVKDLVSGLGERPRRLNTNRFELAEQAAEVIFNNGLRLLVVDDAEELDVLCYNFLRYLFAKTGCAILVIGLKAILDVIMEQEKFENRIKQQLDFPAPTEEEIIHTVLPQLMMPRWTFDPTSEKDQALGRKLWTSVTPSLRDVRGVLQNACMLAELRDDKCITPKLVSVGFQMSRIRKCPGGFGENDEELEEEQETQTEYEDESVRRQREKKKDDEEA